MGVCLRRRYGVSIIYNVRNRVIALLLLLVMIFLSLPFYAFSVSTEDSGAQALEKQETEISPDHSKVSVLHNGAKKPSIVVGENQKETLTSFVTGITPTNRTWQILAPGTNTWVDIYGCNSNELLVGYALVGSMLNSDGIAYIRSAVVAEGVTYVSESVAISIEYSTGEGVEIESPAPMMMRSARAADSTEPELGTYTIVINYIFDNGGIAFEPYGASVAKGSDFAKSIKSPTVVGYEPFRRVDGEYVSAETVDIDIKNISENITINVIYEPAVVDFQVHHHLQDIYDDAYSPEPDYITYGKGLTGSLIGDGLAMTELELPGFSALAYEKLTIAADGSTVVEIRYDRNYYLVSFDMQGGFGVEPVYARYETLVGANVPTRHGYVFDGWQLTRYGNRAPTALESSKYDINSSTINIPDANLTYRARWITQLAGYTMVFWKENVEDNGFSYWGYLDGLTAMSGSYVDGADRISEVGGIDDEAAFTYSSALTDKHVLVEGDGSTIVNVYYTRNRYAITFKAKGLCVIPEKHTHSDECYDLVCSNGHTHTDECIPTLSCDIPEHTSHTDECIACGRDEHIHGTSCCGLTEHTHSTSCYSNVGNSASPKNPPTEVEDGYIFAVRSIIRYTYYIYIAGSWYSYSGRNVSSGDVIDPTCRYTPHTHGSEDCSCKLEEHRHSDACYGDDLHTHDLNNCYTYSCGAIDHVHTDGCRVLDCSIPTGHSHNNTCKSSSSTNTVKIVHRKYQENLEDIWPLTDDNGKVYNSGQRWSPSGSDTYSAVLVYIATMPAESFTLTLSESSNDTYTMKYYLEVLDGDPYDVSYNGKNYVLYTTVKANYNYLTKAEDFFDINGFYQHESNPKFSGNQIDINGGGTVNFYYGRIVDHYLEFQSNGIVLNSYTQYGIPYGANLKPYDFVPPYPESLEPGAYVFEGWYTSPGHFPGTEVNWNTLTMDEGDVLLYAKWSPITHTVKVYFDNTYSQQVGETQYVLHGNFAHNPTETLENGAYVFQGWFYTDVVDGVVEEKAFVFTGIPIVEDLKIYAKWSSHVTVNYTIHYVLFEDGTPIADPTVGSALAGNNKTFYAKAGDDLFDGYKTGYYPLTSSHTVTMSPELGENRVFEFKYVYVPSMPYLVRYLDEYGNSILEEKKVMDNNLSVVTETFIRVDNMMPDAYQKRLVLSASGNDSNGDGIYDENVITFNYSSDEEHAYYKVVHYIENIMSDGYREYRSEDAVGIIGNEYSISMLSLTGFSYNPEKTKVNGAFVPTVDQKVTATLTSEGLLIELYYDRVNVEYVVKYLESGTGNVLYPEKVAYGIYGGQVVEYAPGLTHIGYELVSDSVKLLQLSANAQLNVIEFYYKESTYSIKYTIVGSPDGGNLSLMSENIDAVSGIPTGSMPILNYGYHFVGWFFDENATYPVPAEWVNPVNNEIIPQNDGVWLENHVFYAKIDPDFTSLKISTVGCSDVDAGQVFIFKVQGTDALTSSVNLTVTVVGNGSITISSLPIGNYTVTELTDWSYRYTPDSVSKDISLSVLASNNSLVFSQIRTSTHWLDGNAGAVNNYN